VKNRYLPLIFLICLHLFFLMNLQFTAWPEMLSYPYLRNQGFLLYSDMVHPYTPLLTMVLAVVYRIFGYKLMIMQAFAWILFLTNDILIFLIVRKITKNRLFAYLSLMFYVSTQPFLEGNMLWFDNVLVTPILMGTYLLINKRMFWSGVIFGLAALTKQTAGLFIVISSLWLVISKRNFKNVVYFLTGPVMLGLVLGVRLISEGQFMDFINWTLIYPFTQWGNFPGYVQIGLSKKEFLLLVILLAPLLLGIRKLKWNFLLILFLTSSLIMIYPRFSFFHFQAPLAFLAIIFGYYLSKVKVDARITILYGFLLIATIALPTLKRDWGKDTRFYNSDDLTHAKLVQEVVHKNEPVYFLGPHSSLYALANRVPPKPWADNFGWYYEIGGVQGETISRWGDDPPEYVFWQLPESGNWFDLGTYQPRQIADFIEANYAKGEKIWDNVYIWRKNAN